MYLPLKSKTIGCLGKRIYKKVFTQQIKSIEDFLPPAEPDNGIVLKSSYNSAGNAWDIHLGKILAELKQHPYDFLRCPEIKMTVHPHYYEKAEKFLNIIKENIFSEKRYSASP